MYWQKTTKKIKTHFQIVQRLRIFITTALQKRTILEGLTLQFCVYTTHYDERQEKKRKKNLTTRTPPTRVNRFNRTFFFFYVV